MTAREAYQKVINSGCKPRPDLEEVIAQGSFHSYLYAKHILGGRWALGEAAIATNREACKGYIKMVLQKDRSYREDPEFLAYVLANG